VRPGVVGMLSIKLRSVKELESAIREYIDVHNEDPTPFVWTRTADQILDSIAR
jgi:hypothetical protein